jgi:hypothetical protein
LDNLLDAPINKMSVPKNVEDVFLHVAPRYQSEGLRNIADRIIRKRDPAKELFVGVNRGGRLIESVFIAIREREPFNSHDDRIAEDLGDPFRSRPRNSRGEDGVCFAIAVILRLGNVTRSECVHTASS